jgi:DNA (cytosine-5)-methyltransferase 1
MSDLNIKKYESTKEQRTHIDLFTGIGGFSIAAKVNGVKTIVQCESEEFLVKGLKRAWRVPVIRDVCSFKGRAFRGAWLLTAGVPCQPASRAGKQGGSGDVRWLWPEAIRACKESKPAWVLFENPPGIDDVGLGGIIAQVEGLGYEVGILRIPACAVNSPQDRDRFWIVANRSSQRSAAGNANQATEQEGHASQHDHGTENRTVANTQWNQRRPDEPGRGSSGREATGGNAESGAVADCQENGSGPRRKCTGRPVFEGNASGLWSDFFYVPMPKPDGTVEVRRAPTGLYELAHGLPSRLPKGVGSKIIAALGNAIVWPIAAEIIKAMIESEKHIAK